MGNPGGSWKEAVWMNAIDLLQKWDWKVASRKRYVWRKEIRESMARKLPETL
jgi:hypothetical protein